MSDEKKSRTFAEDDFDMPEMDEQFLKDMEMDLAAETEEFDLDFDSNPFEPDEACYESDEDQIPGKNDMSAVSLFSEDVAGLETLDAPTERMLALDMHVGQRAMTELENNKELSAKQIKALNAEVKRGEEARKKLIESQLGMVLVIAKKMFDGRVPLADMVQEGNLGLIQAVNRYDPDKGARLATYATKYITYNIRHLLRDESMGLIKIPLHLSDKKRRVDRFKNDYRVANGGNYPTREEIAKHTNMSMRSLSSLDKIPTNFVSINSGVRQTNSNKDLEGVTYEDILGAEDDGFAEMLNILERGDMRRELKNVMSGLPLNQIVMLSLRFGTEDGIPRKMKEIGMELGGVTKQRINYIEKQAMARVRRSNIDYLREYI